MKWNCGSGSLAAPVERCRPWCWIRRASRSLGLSTCSPGMPRAAATAAICSPVPARMGSAPVRLDPAQDHVAVCRRRSRCRIRPGRALARRPSWSRCRGTDRRRCRRRPERLHEELDQRPREGSRVRSLAALRFTSTTLLGRAIPLPAIRLFARASSANPASLLPPRRAVRCPVARSPESTWGYRASNRSSLPTRGRPPSAGT